MVASKIERHAGLLLLVSSFILSAISILRFHQTGEWLPDLRAQPLSVGLWTGTGYLISVLGMAAAFILVFRNNDIGFNISSKKIVLFSIAAIIILSVSVPLFSCDVWAYIFYEKLWVMDQINPYLTPPSAFSTDSFFAYFPLRWAGNVFVYGPFTLYVWSAVNYIAGDHILLNLVMSKALSAVLSIAFVLMSALYVRRYIDGDIIFKRKMLVFAAWNPILLVQIAFQGHNDILMALLILCGMVALKERKESAAAFIFALGVLSKGFAFFPIFFYGVWLILHNYDEPRRVLRSFAKIMAVSIATIAVVYFPVWEGWSTITTPTQMLKPSFATLTKSFGEWVFFFAKPFGMSVQLLALKFYNILMWCVAMFLVIKRLKKIDALDNVFYASGLFLLLYYLFLAGWFQVQYVIWCVPLMLACRPESRLLRIFMIYELLALLCMALFIAVPSSAQEIVSVAISNFVTIYMLIKYRREIV